MKPEISIIVPVYNVENYIHKCVDSILAQSFENFELILVDDGSPDNCPAICDQYAAKDPRVRVIHKPNGGLSDARNWGLNIAEGKYVGFVDSDDWIADDMYELLYHSLIENEADIAVCCHYEVVDGELFQINNYDGYPRVLSNVEGLSELLMDVRIKNLAWDKLYKRELFRNVNYPVGVYYEDTPTTYKLFLQASKVSLVNIPKYYYFKRKESITGSKNLKKLQDKFYGAYEKYDKVRSQYRDKIDKATWGWAANVVINEAMELYNYLLRQKDGTGQSKDVEKVKRFLRENLSVIMTAKPIGPKLKMAAIILSTSEAFYSLLYSTLIFPFRKEKNQSLM
ncbi:glycosyltransferase family 2 protein [Paenibacillus sp. URB8-2]|uniref:glycosyltransferase family 2 protein n=1 Tax=Paenibacillus sp. URB8-2 TaxID=2741301 RepID=UPI0015B81F30|nr:glycosyltransferase [Paenibacillus sp. URB8-2]BCG58629.1 glycosyl transferase family 2 [Paenibacillus sp. URB8-2]